MFTEYKNNTEEFQLYRKKSVHQPPRILSALECIYVTEGTLELGIQQELYHMEAGDFAMVFPDMIHHEQVFTPGRNYAIHLVANPALSGLLLPTLQQSRPENPVIKSENVHPDIVYGMTKITPGEPNAYTDIARQAYVQIVLARALPYYTMIDKTGSESNDIIDRVVEYIARHFTENITLTSMAEDLYVSPYTLSRIFSGTFHTNFNRYLNHTRLRHVVHLLKYTNQTITEAYMNAGFESQRTFNRAFLDVYRMSPREYRNQLRAELDN
ncbi:MAG: helix-turn-helix domain-containing protein [Lachnospiraceae bacterium]|nr:helix-turn-helix domain-containing protein [Lachnospiraceae bacterium]